MGLDYKIIGERIKKERLAKSLTQEQLAEKLDVSVAFLSRAERGDVKINLARMTQISDILGVSLNEILTSTVSTSKDYLTEDFSNLFKNCPKEKLKLIYAIAKVIINEK